ncbi:phosphonate ABC transporter ATP-binding protein [Sulfurimonas sp.]|uniref:phosphonate ABC transporter ATP-binding protein n=1 Tax=Sulfurimonas sp. TaxID=2022749 RepID=UPI001A02FD6D|nr:phosphonate ABC transporter ATP-binding protein [Sulfurimonas sp.]MBE0515217.1 phosphonate ABC transporter ATP-binding protein [Sulfurimonas sp.]
MKIEIRNLSKKFGDQKVLDDINLTIKQGQKVAFIGLSGSGKTTLMRSINGFVTPDVGEIIVDGKKIDYRSKKEVKELRAKVAMVYQLFNLIERTTVLHNVLTGTLGKKRVLSESVAVGMGFFKKSDKKKAKDILEFVKLADKYDERVDSLSGGQKQRVAIARALMQEPKILLADEPTANLDIKTGKKILKLFSKINEKEHTTTITVIHQLELISEKYFDRVIGLSNGKLIFDGHPDELTHEILTSIYGDLESSEDDEEFGDE